MERQINLLLEKTNALVEINTELKDGINRLLNPPKPEFVTAKQACMMLNRSHAVVLRYIKAMNVEPNVIGSTKSYKHSDIEEIARQLGITVTPLS